jgi:Protein of unknown function (DUF1569)
MENMFNAADRAALQHRLSRLQPSSRRQWGKMNAAQMLAHCAAAMEMACGDRQKKQAFLGKLITPFIRSTVLGPKPLRRNSPTDPDLLIADEREFAAERQRLSTLVDRFCQAGPDAAGRQIHSFFGRFNGEEWGRLVYKHLDHHLRQFGV